MNVRYEYELYSLDDGDIRAAQLMDDEEARERNTVLMNRGEACRWVRCDQNCIEA